MVVLNVLLVAVVFIVMIAVLVGAHELGHYLFARWCGMRVNEFAIGFGRPILWRFLQKRHRLPNGEEFTTDYTFRAWPIGGFVMIHGMEPEEDGSETKISGGFYSRPQWQQLAVLFAGPLFSVLAGIVLLSSVYMTAGISWQSNKVFGYGKNMSAARDAGVELGDRIISVNGQRTDDGFQVRSLIQRSSGPIQVRIQRGPTTKDLTIRPTLSPVPVPVVNADGSFTGEQKRVPMMGLAFEPIQRKMGAAEAISKSLASPLETVQALMRLIAKPQNAENEVGGMIMMVQATNAVLGEGIAQVMTMAGLLSISLGIFNLLPIPPLDGGKMVIAVVEMIRGGRRLSMKWQLALMNTGVALMLIMFVSVMWIDLKRLFAPKEVGPAITITNEPREAAPAQNNPASNR